MGVDWGKIWDDGYERVCHLADIDRQSRIQELNEAAEQSVGMLLYRNATHWPNWEGAK
jgi:hypothetical protein